MDNSIELHERLVVAEEVGRDNTRRLNEHDKQIEELKETNSILKNMNYRMEKVESAVDKIDKKLDEKVSEDNTVKSKKWDKLIDYLFYTIIGLGLGYIAYKIGLK